MTIEAKQNRPSPPAKEKTMPDMTPEELKAQQLIVGYLKWAIRLRRETYKKLFGEDL